MKGKLTKVKHYMKKKNTNEKNTLWFGKSKCIKIEKLFLTLVNHDLEQTKDAVYTAVTFQ